MVIRSEFRGLKIVMRIKPSSTLAELQTITACMVIPHPSVHNRNSSGNCSDLTFAATALFCCSKRDWISAGLTW